MVNTDVNRFNNLPRLQFWEEHTSHTYVTNKFSTKPNLVTHLPSSRTPFTWSILVSLEFLVGRSLVSDFKFFRTLRLPLYFGVASPVVFDILPYTEFQLAWLRQSVLLHTLTLLKAPDRGFARSRSLRVVAPPTLLVEASIGVLPGLLSSSSLSSLEVRLESGIFDTVVGSCFPPHVGRLSGALGSLGPEISSSSWLLRLFGRCFPPVLG